MSLVAISALLGLALWEPADQPDLVPAQRNLSAGGHASADLVTFCLESNNPLCVLAHERGYLLTGSCPSWLQPLLKKLVGLSGDLLEITTVGLTLNGRRLPGTARPERDRSGRNIPPSLR
ncbi:MAG: hypothetical protein LBP22_01080 [Deltaproteobacteria bacterium]|nr:hypothetical protein [Deltaproteobacteria bacterium]